MTIRKLTDRNKTAYDKVVTHVIQSWEWGEFRKSLGLELVRLGHFEKDKLVKAYELTFHPVPFLNQTIGYFPKGPLPDHDMVQALRDIGKQKNAAFVKLEPNVLSGDKYHVSSIKLKELGLVKSPKALFTKYNFVLDLAKSEDELLAGMHPKTRYNIRLAQKKGVEVYESTKDEDFKKHLKLYFETTKRQNYFGHTPHYHKLVWETLRKADMVRVLIGTYQKTPLVSWMIFNFGDTLYYPYGGSSVEHKDVMASNLVAWEAIKLGRKMNLKSFDMWGALGPEPDPKDPWYGFHRFKAGYGATHVEYIGTYDLVLNPSLYYVLNFADKLRWMFLRTFGR